MSEKDEKVTPTPPVAGDKTPTPEPDVSTTLVDAKTVAKQVHDVNKRIDELLNDKVRTLEEKNTEMEKRVAEMAEAHRKELEEIKKSRGSDYADIIEGELTVEDLINQKDAISAVGKVFHGGAFNQNLTAKTPRMPVYKALMQVKPDFKTKSGLWNEGLHNMKRLNDLLYWEAVLTGNITGWKAGETRIKPEALPHFEYYNEWKELSKHYQKALAVANTAAGAEWVPTEFSSQVIDLIELEAGLKNFFPKYAFGQSGTLTVPRLDGRETGYYGGEPTADDAAAGTASNLATGNVSFTPRRIYVIEYLSEDTMDTSLPNSLDAAMKSIPRVIDRTIEEALLDGDRTNPHQDSDVTTSKDRRKAWNALRKLASLGSDSESVGDYATAVKILTSKNNMLHYALKPSDLLFVIGHDIFNYAMILQDDSTNKNRLTVTYNAGGPLGMTIWKGMDQNQPILGMRLYVSEFVRRNLNASGVYDATTMTKTYYMIVNTRGFGIATKKEFVMKSAEHIEDFQTVLVGSTRLDFQKLYATTTPVHWYGYNVTRGVA